MPNRNSRETHSPNEIATQIVEGWMHDFRIVMGPVSDELRARIAHVIEGINQMHAELWRTYLGDAPQFLPRPAPSELTSADGEDYAHVEPFGIDNAELAGLTLPEAFVMGVEFAAVRAQALASPKEFTVCVHEKNAPRVLAMLRANVRKVRFRRTAPCWVEIVVASNLAD